MEGRDPLAEASEVEADCIQMFLSNPQGWEKPPERDDAEELRTSPVGVYVHAPYLINVCSPKPNIRHGSRKILTQTCEAAAAVGALAVIVHPGHAEDGLDAGVGRMAKTLEQLESEVPVYLENTAGGDHAVARRFDALARLWEAVEGADTGVEVGFCFDTCHAHAAGEELIRRGRAGDRDHRRHRSPPRQRLARSGRNRSRSARQHRRRDDRPRRPPAHDQGGTGAVGGRDPARGRGAARRRSVRPRRPGGLSAYSAGKSGKAVRVTKAS